MTLQGLKIQIGKLFSQKSINKAAYTNTRQNVKVLVGSGYDFKGDQLIYLTKANDTEDILNQLYKIEEILQQGGLGHYCSLDEDKMVVYLCDDAGL